MGHGTVQLVVTRDSDGVARVAAPGVLANDWAPKGSIAEVVDNVPGLVLYEDGGFEYRGYSTSLQFQYRTNLSGVRSKPATVTVSLKPTDNCGAIAPSQSLNTCSDADGAARWTAPNWPFGCLPIFEPGAGVTMRADMLVMENDIKGPVVVKYHLRNIWTGTEGAPGTLTLVTSGAPPNRTFYLPIRSGNVFAGNPTPSEVISVAGMESGGPPFRVVRKGGDTLVNPDGGFEWNGEPGELTYSTACGDGTLAVLRRPFLDFDCGESIPRSRSELDSDLSAALGNNKWINVLGRASYEGDPLARDSNCLLSAARAAEGVRAAVNAGWKPDQILVTLEGHCEGRAGMDGRRMEVHVDDGARPDPPNGTPWSPTVAECGRVQYLVPRTLDADGTPATARSHLCDAALPKVPEPCR